DAVVCGPPYGSGLAGASQQGTVTVVDATTGSTLRRLGVVGAATPMSTCGAFTGDGRSFVLDAIVPQPNGAVPDPGQAEGDAIAVYDARDWARPASVVRTPAPVVEATPGRETVAVQLADGTLEVIRAADLAVLARARRPELVTDCR